MALPEDDFLDMAGDKATLKACPNGGYQCSHVINDSSGGAEKGRWQLIAWGYADDMRDEQAFVIDQCGRLLRPDKTVDLMKKFQAEVAQVETWSDIPQDCLVLYWCRQWLSAKADCRVIKRPESMDITDAQKSRVKMLQTKLQNIWSEKQKHNLREKSNEMRICTVCWEL